MFIVKAIKQSKQTSMNDIVLDSIERVGDVVIEITGSKIAGRDAAQYAAGMQIGDVLTNFSWGYSIECVPNMIGLTE